MPQINRPHGLSRSTLFAVSIGLAAIIAVAVATPARAQDEPAPRVAVEMDGMSVVLVAANGRLQAYVDEIADNAPVTDAVLEVRLRDGSGLALQQVSPGLFVAPFAGGGAGGVDVLLVTLGRSGAAGSAQAVAELSQPRRPPIVAAEPVTALSAGRLAWLLAGVVLLAALLGVAYRPAMRAWRPMGQRAA